jgi:hypothetical protein
MKGALMPSRRPCADISTWRSASSPSGLPSPVSIHASRSDQPLHTTLVSRTCCSGFSVSIGSRVRLQLFTVQQWRKWHDTGTAAAQQ